MKQNELSIWLRAIIALIFICCVFLSLSLVPALGKEAVRQNPVLQYLFWPCLVFFWVSVVPVFMALFLAWRVFTDIGQNKSFSHENASRLRTISCLAVIDTILYIAAIIILAIIGVLHPGIFLILLAVVFVGSALAVASAALSHLTRNAADLKNDNDLTI